MRKEELIKQVAESTGIAICEVRTVIEAALKDVYKRQILDNPELFVKTLVQLNHFNRIDYLLSIIPLVGIDFNAGDVYKRQSLNAGKENLTKL